MELMKKRTEAKVETKAEAEKKAGPPALTEKQAACEHCWHTPANGRGPVLCSYCGADRVSYHHHPRVPRKA